MNGARLHFIVEGQTEETFVNLILVPQLTTFSVWGDARCVMTSKKRGIKYRGGLSNYAKAKNDIVLWMKEDQNQDSFFTTMFDLYALPSDFPDYTEARKIVDPHQRVTALEDAMRRDIDHRRFVPYIQLHEFEALLLADPQKMDSAFPERGSAINNLTQMVSDFDSPELIDDGYETAPSKRIIEKIPEYKGMKASAGPRVAQKIGLSTLRQKCPHFSEWLGKLERLAQ